MDRSAHRRQRLFEVWSAVSIFLILSILSLLNSRFHSCDRGAIHSSNTEGAYSSDYAAPSSFEKRLLNDYLLIIDHRLTAKYKFTKPNDRRALDLMNAAAETVMKELPDLVLAYGNSDEFRYATPSESFSRSV
jgi:hypothetical protein